MHDHHAELRQTYLGAAPHTLVMGLVWIASAVLGEAGLPLGLLILVFFLTAGAAFSLGEVLRRRLGYADRLSAGNGLPQLFLFLGATIPLSFPVVYMAVRHNPDWFFSAFAIVVGGHYLPFIWAYRLPTFGLLGTLLIVTGCACAFLFPESLTLPAFLTGGALLLFAGLHFRMVQRELAVAAPAQPPAPKGEAPHDPHASTV